MIKYYLFVFFLFSKSLFSQSSFNKQLRRSLSKSTYDSQLTMIIILSIIIIALIVFILVVMNRHKIRARDILKSNNNFARLVVKHDISPSEKTLLKELALFGKVKSLGLLVHERDFFNENVEKYLLFKIKGLSLSDRNVIFSKLTSIRRKLSFNVPRPLLPIKTTKEIPVGMGVKLKIGKKIYESSIVGNTEEFLYIFPPEKMGTIKSKLIKNIIISFYREKDGHYFIHSKFRGYLKKTIQALALEHVSHLDNSVKRKFTRGNLNLDSDFFVVKQPFLGINSVGKKLYKGRIVDFSAGGVQLLTRSILMPDDYIILGFSVYNKYSFKKLSAKVVNVDEQNGVRHCHCSFVALNRKIIEKLDKAVYHSNHIDLSEMEPHL